MAKHLSSLAKIAAPRLRAVHANERLFELLDRACKRPVIWIYGPPGAGKTTLAASYLKSRRLQPLWYRLDGGDADPPTFFYYLGLAVKNLAHRSESALPLLTPEYSRGLPAFTRCYFESLYERLPQRCVVVFDDYHEVALDSPWHDLLPHGLSETPDTTNVFIVSRREPPPQFSRLRANDLLEVLSPDALRLSLEEVRGVVQCRGKSEISEQDVARLTDVTQGWVAGVILMLESGMALPSRTESFDSDSPQLVFNYFAEEVLRQLNPASRDMLLATAFLPTFTVEMAEKLTGLGEARNILEELVRKNYFTIRDVQTQPLYRYHPLFREFLLARAREAYATERLSLILKRAAELLESSGQPEAAFDLLLQAEDWDGISRIVLKWAKALIEQGRHNVLARWLDRLPEPLFDDNGWLCYWRGFALMPVTPAATIPWCERAFKLFKRDRERSGLLLSWARIIQAIRFDPNGDVKQMDPWIAMADELLAEDSSFPSEEIEYQFVYGIYVALQHRMPWHPRFNSWKDRAISLGLSSTGSANRAYLAYLAVSYETQRGHLLQAKFVLDAVSRVRDLSALARNFSYLGRIQLQIELGQLDEALSTMASGLEYSRTVGIHTWDTFLRWHGGRAALMRGDIKLAQRLLAEMAANANITSGVAGCYYSYLASLIALLQGALPEATGHAERAVELAEVTGWLVSKARSQLLYSRVLQERGRLNEAGAQVADMLLLAARIDYPALVSQGLLQQALLAFAQNDSDKGLDALRKGLALARELSFKQSLWLCPADGIRLCARALEAKIEPDFVKEVIRQRGVSPQAPDIEHWPWPLKVYTLGRFALMQNDTEVRFQGKSQKKPLELLRALIALGGKNVDVGMLAQALWPDAEGDAAEASLKIALHRLRKLLGDDELIKLTSSKLSLDPTRTWVDAWALEHLAGRAEEVLSGDADEDLARLEERIFRLYQGHFLALEAEQPWALAPRVQLKNRFVRLILLLGQRHEQDGQWDRSVMLYQRGLEQDNLVEELYRRLMVCHQKRGQPAEALNVYRRCRESLSIILGVRPSVETEAIHQSLVQRG